MGTQEFTLPELDAGAVVASATTRSADAALERTREEAERIRAEAESRGYAEGYERGLADAQATAEPILAALRELLARVEELQTRTTERFEERAVELALALADKVLGGAFEGEPALVLEVVRGALRRAGQQDLITIEVNPADVELVREAAGELVASFGGIGRFEIVAERRVGRGGCILRTSEGEIDGALDTQLEAARTVIRDLYRARAHA
jgi:flagellar biosynthesis/type III secretory pathway protein FliH